MPWWTGAEWPPKATGSEQGMELPFPSLPPCRLSDWACWASLGFRQNEEVTSPQQHLSNRRRKGKIFPPVFFRWIKTGPAVEIGVRSGKDAGKSDSFSQHLSEEGRVQMHAHRAVSRGLIGRSALAVIDRLVRSPQRPYPSKGSKGLKWAMWFNPGKTRSSGKPWSLSTRASTTRASPRPATR